jgi:hypothetical protein
MGNGINADIDSQPLAETGVIPRGTHQQQGLKHGLVLLARGKLRRHGPERAPL